MCRRLFDRPVANPLLAASGLSEFSIADAVVEAMKFPAAAADDASRNPRRENCFIMVQPVIVLQSCDYPMVLHSASIM